MANDDNWSEYSRLVLKELEALANGIEGLRSELQEVKEELAAMRAREDKVDDLKIWKEKIDEVASPTRFSALIKEVEDLKMFKTKAITIFVVIQFLMAAIMFSKNLFGL